VSELELGLLVALVTVGLLLLGAPVAFVLGSVAIVFLIAIEGVSALDILPNVFYGGLDNFALLSIPMFIVMGGAVASSRAGSDLYEALDRWLYRVPGGLMVSNIGACAIFAALSGSSPATCAAIGKMGIPEMRKRGYADGLATGAIAAGGTLGILIPPSITMIVYGILDRPPVPRRHPPRPPAHKPLRRMGPDPGTARRRHRETRHQLQPPRKARSPPPRRPFPP